MVEVCRCDLGEEAAELRPHRIGDGGMGVGVALELPRDGALHAGVVVGQVDGHRPARDVEVAVALAVEDIDTLGALDGDIHGVIGEHVLPVAIWPKRVGEVVEGLGHRAVLR